MNGVLSFVTFMLGLLFQGAAGVVVYYLATHHEDRHRLPRLSSYFVISAITIKAVADGAISTPWELVVLSLGWALGIYSLAALVLRIMRAHVIADKIHARKEPLCLDCPLLNDLLHGEGETPRFPLPPIRFFEIATLPAWLAWISWLPFWRK